MSDFENMTVKDAKELNEKAEMKESLRNHGFLIGDLYDKLRELSDKVEKLTETLEESNEDEENEPASIEDKAEFWRGVLKKLEEVSNRRDARMSDLTELFNEASHYVLMESDNFTVTKNGFEIKYKKGE